MAFESKEKKRMKKTAEEILKSLGTIRIPPNAIRSIEELAKIHREIEGLGIGYLSRSQIKWLEEGGMEVFKHTKPLIYNLLQEMWNKPGVFPVNLREVAEKVQERIREKAEKGEISNEWKDIRVTPSEVDSILRFKRDPFFSKQEKTRLMAETLVEILGEMYQEEKKRHKIEEPEIKVALEVAKKWLQKFMRAQGALATKKS